ncbi:hypothetical protein C3B44_01000 [Corynebacterium yudongzhengii]|uniref:Uncharacterized protein n=1 Tax=Corynebacterium yudongzhengii TaxID=2080740 RepID=A0A2U1T5D1_9CORY|nr:hypothetical protein C3B44_01000 [Corynebacterium yudongzhengii]PWC01216.1 hypothetical protein DF222_08530 [Corynebacterium yudongzhengii]
MLATNPEKSDGPRFGGCAGRLPGLGGRAGAGQPRKGPCASDVTPKTFPCQPLMPRNVQALPSDSPTGTLWSHPSHSRRIALGWETASAALRIEPS